MKNSKPFKILDSYSDECFYLYTVVKSINNYPNITEDEHVEGKLYATAFAYLCAQYLKATIDAYEYDDWDELVLEMNFQIDKTFFEEKKQTFIKEQEDVEDFSELVWNGMQQYQKQIIQDLTNTFGKSKMPQLFASIFDFNEEGYIPETSLKELNFFDEL